MILWRDPFIVWRKQPDDVPRRILLHRRGQVRLLLKSKLCRLYHSGKTLKQPGPIPWGHMDTTHMANLVETVLSRKAFAVNADVPEGHPSAGHQ